MVVHTILDFLALDIIDSSSSSDKISVNMTSVFLSLCLFESNKSTVPRPSIIIFCALDWLEKILDFATGSTSVFFRWKDHLVSLVLVVEAF